jgi:uridine kinase
MNSQQPFLVIGIAGGTGSGKSTLVEHLLASEIGDEIAVLPHDHYYLSRELMPEWLKATENWDHPEAIDNQLYISHLDLLMQGNCVESPQYCFETHSRRSDTRPIPARRILLVEGILIFAIPEICHRLQWRVFIDATSDERVLRRLVRDTQGRGRSLASVVQQYRTSVRPMHDRYIQPSRDHAHLILPNINPTSLEKGAQLLCGFLRTQLQLA